MTLQLNNANGNNVQLDYTDQAGGSDVDILFPQTSGTVNLVERPGNIIQIVTASTNVEVLGNNTSWTDIGLTANITPEYSDSVIIINSSICMLSTSTTISCGAGVRLLRGTDVIYNSNNNSVGPLGSYVSMQGSGATSSAHRANHPVMFFDTTYNTTNALTYHFEGRAYNGNVSFQENTNMVVPGQSFMTIMEVKA